MLSLDVDAATGVPALLLSLTPESRILLDSTGPSATSSAILLTLGVQLPLAEVSPPVTVDDDLLRPFPVDAEPSFDFLSPDPPAAILDLLPVVDCETSILDSSRDDEEEDDFDFFEVDEVSDNFEDGSGFAAARFEVDFSGTGFFGLSGLEADLLEVVELELAIVLLLVLLLVLLPVDVERW